MRSTRTAARPTLSARTGWRLPHALVREHDCEQAVERLTGDPAVPDVGDGVRPQHLCVPLLLEISVAGRCCTGLHTTARSNKKCHLSCSFNAMLASGFE